jgi:peptide deformylase
MGRLTILEYPDRRLRTKARPVSSFDATLQRLIADMFETMYAARGIGLAASQVDVHLRVIAIDASAQADTPEVFVNPKILSRGKIGLVEESCLSLPGVVANVQRATQVRVRAQDAVGSFHDRDLEGLPAVCLQHEMDHLDGRLFVDHLSWFKRLQIRRRSRLGRLSHAASEPALATQCEPVSAQREAGVGAARP